MRIFSVGRVASPLKEATRFIPVAEAAQIPATSPSKPPSSISTYPDPSIIGRQWGEDKYKILRLQEAAGILKKDPVLAPHIVNLLAMLLQEDGTMTAERRHDCSKGVCYAIGIQGHNICKRGTPLIYDEYEDPSSDSYLPHQNYCHWKNGVSPQKQFERDYPDFAKEWRVQLQEYTLRMRRCYTDGGTDRSCVQGWNPNEYGRVGKVKEHEPLVRAALGV